eukprot:SAG22_NODE_162_length_16848_cov_16.978267_7_plen_164_part_00
MTPHVDMQPALKTTQPGWPGKPSTTSMLPLGTWLPRLVQGVVILSSSCTQPSAYMFVLLAAIQSRKTRTFAPSAALVARTRRHRKAGWFSFVSDPPKFAGLLTQEPSNRGANPPPTAAAISASVRPSMVSANGALIPWALATIRCAHAAVPLRASWRRRNGQP